MLHVYINGELCDIDINKKDILFKRVLLDPAKLNTEDIQRSYQIQLPKSEKNNRIFGFRNVEEVKGKFNSAFPAEVYVNDVRILEGHFVLSKITEDAYIGNVGVLYQKSIKDIFGDRTMNQAGDWIINDFGAFKESIEEWNAKEGTPECIFPAVLYGLLAKVKDIRGEYSSKNVWDHTVRLGMDDLMPSVNCLQMIKNIFEKEGEGYTISGSAFGDQRLNKLYMSYKNPVDYEPDWNYQRNGKIDLAVDWSLQLNRNNSTQEYIVERTTIPANSVYTTELLSTTNGKVTINSDEGYNIVKTPLLWSDGRSYTRYGVIIPRSGIYRVQLSATITLDTTTTYNVDKHSYRDKDKVIRAFNARHNAVTNPSNTSLFDKSQYEIKVLRDRGEGDFHIENNRFDRSYFSPVINQNDKTNEEDYPKYYPEAGKTMFIDPEQNNKLVCGISFGMDSNPVSYDGNAQNKKCNPIAIKGGLSWNNENMDFISAASHCDGYYKGYPVGNNNVQYDKVTEYRVETNLPENFAETSVDKAEGTGRASVLIYLEKGERLTLVDTSLKYGNDGTTMHTTKAQLTIEPYKKNEEWLSDQLKVTGENKSKIIDNTEKNDFLENEINLTSFLPGDEKIDDWLDNFCKAFNLTLTQTDEKTFELNIKQVRQTSMLSVIDVQTYQEHRNNSDLNLPPEYIVRFTVDEEEEGYVKTEEKGGGSYKTGVETGNNIEQYSNFSYCWYKQLKDSEDKELIKLPVISDREVWRLEDDTRDYEEMQQKWYVNKRQRFWYRDSTIRLPGLGESNTLLCTVKNELPGYSILDYYDKPLSILDNFFTLFVNSDNCYTEIECFLTPEEYQSLPYSMVRFNGDIYYPAEVNNYDPHGSRKATLKLIRKL